jgi:hypothetical protein
MPATTIKELAGTCVHIFGLLMLVVQGMLRTREVMERLKSVAPQPGQKPPILVYLGVLLQKGKLNAQESTELARWAGPGSDWRTMHSMLGPNPDQCLLGCLLGSAGWF